METKRLIPIVLAFFMLSIFSCKTSMDDKLVGTWEIDTVYFVDAQEVLPKFAKRVVDFYHQKLEEVEDSLKALTEKGLENYLDTVNFISLDNRRKYYETIIRIYSDSSLYFKNFENAFRQAIGLRFTFNPDHTLQYPDTSAVATWEIKDNKLILRLDDKQSSLNIEKLTNKQFIYSVEQELDTALTIKVVYHLKKIKK